MIKVKIVTDYPVAYNSPDHLDPLGTSNDNTKNGAYVRELIKRCGPDMKYMDIGCSGGGFVRQFIDHGVFAVGVEGSDYSLKNKRAEWATIPDNLFTSDITKPFHFVDEENCKILFDAISAWDVMEHIYKVDLPEVINNIYNNLKENGIFIASIATFEGKHHHTLELKPWWDNLFESHGFIEDDPMVNWGRPCNESWNIPTDFEVVYKKVK